MAYSWRATTSRIRTRPTITTPTPTESTWTTPALVPSARATHHDCLPSGPRSSAMPPPNVIPVKAGPKWPRVDLRADPVNLVWQFIFGLWFRLFSPASLGSQGRVAGRSRGPALFHCPFPVEATPSSDGYGFPAREPRGRAFPGRVQHSGKDLHDVHWPLGSSARPSFRRPTRARRSASPGNLRGKSASASSTLLHLPGFDHIALAHLQALHFARHPGLDPCRLHGAQTPRD